MITDRDWGILIIEATLISKKTVNSKKRYPDIHWKLFQFETTLIGKQKPIPRKKIQTQIENFLII